MNFKISIPEDSATPVLKRLAALAPQEYHQAMGLRVQEVTRAHLIRYSATHPNKLGGARSNYWARAGTEVASPAALAVSPGAAVLSINTPGINRAFQDITIFPGTQTPGVKNLTFPAIPQAYNRRAAGVSGLVPMFRNRRAVGLIEGEEATRQKTTRKGKKGDTFRREKPGGTVWYWFAKKAEQKQDRSLLPSDQEFTDAARAGAADFVQAIRTGKIS